MPDVLENGGPGCDTDAGADEDGNFVFKDVLGGGAVRSVDEQLGHFLAVQEGDFVHPQRV